ncbi:MAG: hypothetical protein HY403_09995, partial [Elusimicrobia bacterium]|nr:hypothetical protein [Elusimicrobiota bacterium]
LLNTAILSTLLTYPRAVSERWARAKQRHPLSRLTPGEVAWGAADAALSWDFWHSNLKSFVGLATVGAEIEGIMTYADQFDAALDPAFEAAFGVKPGIFHAVGAAVERPDEWTGKDGVKHENLIPFGGAITWGNVLLYKLQTLAGFNISDAVMGSALLVKGAALGEGATDLPALKASAQGVIAASSERTKEQGLPFDPDLWKKPPSEVADRIKELAGKAGRLDAEIAAVKDHGAKLRAELGDKRAKLERLEKLSRPVTESERAEHERLLAALSAKSDEVGVREKLAERRDLLAPPSDAAALARLEALRKEHEGMMPPPPPDRNGYWEDLAAQDSSLKALAQRLGDYAEGRAAPAPGGAASTLPAGMRAEMNQLVAQIKSLRAAAQDEIALRDATSSLLVSSDRLGAALRERRGGKDMLRFHTDMAKLASVMDLALSLNEINAAQAAIKRMTDMLAAKRAKIAASRADNGREQAAADRNLGLDAQRRAEVDKEIADDESTIKDLADSALKARMVPPTLSAFETVLRAFISEVNAQDRAYYDPAAGRIVQSADAAAEYQRRLDLLPRIQGWRSNGGNPYDPDGFSLKKLNDYVRELDDNIAKARSGLSRMTNMPVEYAGTLIALVPGPEGAFVNPPQEQMRQMLAARKTHWEGKRADFGKSLDSVLRMLGQTDTQGRAPATAYDEFGDSHPESLPEWLGEQRSAAASAEAAARRHLSRLDALADNVNRATQSSIPKLAPLGLKELQDAIKTYGDSLRAVKFPEGETVEGHAAMMDLVAAAQLVPQAAREIIRWSKADATATAVDDAIRNTLPKARDGLRGLDGMFGAILGDAAADLAFVNAGGGDNQALINRKTVLLRDNILPALQGARGMLTETLIPYQRKSIDDIAAAGGDYFKLYDSKKTVIQEADKLLNRTVPWAFATFGAAEGNQAEAARKIGEWRHKLQKNLDGYDDAQGHHKGVHEYQVDMANRRDPNFAGTEPQHGEAAPQPYSLPRKIAQYTAERAQRAAEINAQDAQINEILDQIERISKGRYAMSGYRMPVGVTPDAAGVARLDEGRAVQRLADRLKAVADETKTAAAAIGIGGGGGDGTVPTGTQPRIAISENQQISLLALEAGNRRVYTAPSAVAFARFLYADSVIAAATDALNVQVPATERFLGRVSAALGEAISDIARDEAYAAGSGEPADQVFARKIRVFTALDGLLLEAQEFFRTKQGWGRAKFSTLDRVQTYYDSLRDIRAGGLTVNDNEDAALDQMLAALGKTMSDLEAKRLKISEWLNQLNSKEKSALNYVSEALSLIMDKSQAALDAKIDRRQLLDKLGSQQQTLKALFSEIDGLQNKLARILAQPEVEGQLTPEEAREIASLRLGRSGWALGGSQAEPASMVVRKSEYGAFVDALLGLVTQGARSSAAQVSAIKADLLRNPQGLAALIPNTQVHEYGDAVDGFYLVYQSQFSVPHGLNTTSWVTLGNIGKVFGSNVSLSGYQLASPPSVDGENAPYGDKGVEIQVESLEGRNWINYLNIDLHRFAFDIPADNNVKTGMGENRLMIFNDFAYMSDGKDLYVGLAGFADGAVDDAKNKPYYYGGNLKTSVKMTKVLTLKAEQRALWAEDPRKFLQEVNLDFTGFDPDLNRDFAIMAEGDKKKYFRTQVGPQLDLNRLMNPDGGGDSFTLDLYWAKTAGTDDINQQAGGVSVLKGFSLKNKEGKTWMRVDNRLTGEYGQKQNEIGDRITVSLPDSGLVVSGEGKIIGGAKTYFAQVAKKMGDNTNISLSYGSQYVGMKNRAVIATNTSYTLAEIWQKVHENSARNLRGGEPLEAYNRDFADFFKSDEAKSSRAATELERVFKADVAQKLVTQELGGLAREIQELRKAGAFLDNTRVQGMVGFVSGPVSNDLAERALGGGPTVASHTGMTLGKHQKQLIETKSVALYREGLRLQDRMLSVTKDWQAAVVGVAEAQWALRLEDFAVQNAPSEVSRREAAARLSEAESRLHQAVLRYNALTGRDPRAPTPFQDLNSEDLRLMLGGIRRLMAAPDRLAVVLGGLGEDALKASLGKNPFNVMDWIPWVERLTLGVGVQLQDAMAGQAFTLGASVRLPFYNPAAKGADKAYALESQAAREEMKQAYAERARAHSDALEAARIWEASARAVEPNTPASARALSEAIRGYRNGLIPPEKLRAAFSNWNWYMSASLESLARVELLRAQAGADAPFAPAARGDGAALRLGSIEDAFAAASANSHSLGEIAKRQEAAEEMSRAADRRIQKAWLGIGAGVGLTAFGMGWLPSFGITGVPITPTLGFELKSDEMRELQVREHGRQAEYYKALKSRVESGLAVQFYQNMVALRSAESRGAVYDERLLPELKSAAAAGGAEAVRRYDAAKHAREAARLEYARARATINFLLGRPAEAPVEAAIDERQALEALSRLLAAKDPAGAQRRILEARVSVAKAVEEMVDKNMKVALIEADLNIVVRGFGRLLSAFSDSAFANPQMAAAARVQTLTEERERDAYGARRDVEIAQRRLELNAARAALLAVKGESPEALLEKSRLASAVFALQAGLLALGVDPDAVSEARTAAPPRKWEDLTRSLAASERSLTAFAPGDRPDASATEETKKRSAAFARYYYAKQTLGRAPIGEHFLEGGIELRLSDPDTSPEALLALAKLGNDKADRLSRDAQTGAAARAELLAARFAGDARLLRHLEREGIGRDDGALPALRERLAAQGREIIARLGLAPETRLEELLSLAPRGGAGLPELASQLIADIRGRQLDSIRRTLFDGSAPAGWGDEDGLMGRIKADAIAQRMSYKGVTPVAAFGYFRGAAIQSGFLEAPDPSRIAAGLEKVMGEILRKDMRDSGRLQALTFRLHSLMVGVEDGAKGLEARRGLIEAAENDLRARAEVSGKGSAEYLAAQDALIAAWDDFTKLMTSTKADFTALVAELEALGEGSAGAPRPFAAPDRPEARVPNDPKERLLDYWTDRHKDPSFEEGLEALFARMGTAVPSETRARIAASAAAYRTALRDADEVAVSGDAPARKFERLVKIDLEGRRLSLRAELQTALRGVGLLDPASNPAAKDFLAFMRADLAAASKAFALERGEKVRVDRALSETYWRARQPTRAEAAIFSRLDGLNAAMEDARDRLLTSYLADSGDDAASFVLKDLELDAYLKAQGAFDAELLRALEGKPSPAALGALEGLYGLRETFDRSIARAKHGRGMAALDALIMLEQSRLRAARWTGQAPSRVDPIASALSRLKETRERWSKGQVGPGLQPLYAVTRLDAEGRRTWAVDQWLSAEQFEAMRRDGEKNPGAKGALITRGGGYFIDHPAKGAGRYEVIGGVDAADAARRAADTKFRDNRGLADLQAKMKDSDFVAPG